MLIAISSSLVTEKVRDSMDDTSLLLSIFSFDITLCKNRKMWGFSKEYGRNGSSMVFLFLVELLHTWSARSWAPWVRKCGKLPIQENFAITWETPTARSSAPQAYQHKFQVVCGEGFLCKTNGNPRFVKHKQLRSSGKSTQNKKKFISNLLL